MSRFTRFSLPAALAFLAAASMAPPALADVVQGTVSPSDARAEIKDASGTVVATVGPGAYEVLLPSGVFQAVCVAPHRGTTTLNSGSTPTIVNIVCQ